MTVETSGTKIKEAILVVICILAIVTLFMWGERLYWDYWPFNPLTVHSLEILNKDHKVCAGGSVLYRLELTKNMECSVVIKRALEDGHVINYPIQHSPSRSIGHHNILGVLPVPTYADGGVYTMRWEGDCFLGPRNDRMIPYSKESESFEVVRCK